MTAEVSQSVDSQDEGSVGVAGTSHEVDLTLDEETPQDTSATTHEQVCFENAKWEFVFIIY